MLAQGTVCHSACVQRHRAHQRAKSVWIQNPVASRNTSKRQKGTCTRPDSRRRHRCRPHKKQRVHFIGDASFCHYLSRNQKHYSRVTLRPSKTFPANRATASLTHGRKIVQPGSLFLSFDSAQRISHIYSSAAPSFAFAFASIQLAYTSTSSSSAFTFDECSAPHLRQLTLCTYKKPSSKIQRDQ
jgi:hypothetical protein